MKLYHYVSKGNNVLEVGLLSFGANPNADLNYYKKRSGAETHEEICAWMESCFKGRSNAIRFFTSPLIWTEKGLRLKELVESSDFVWVKHFFFEKCRLFGNFIAILF